VNPSAKAWARALEMTASLERDATRTLPSLVDEWAARRGDAPALILANSTLTYASVAAWVNRYARWAIAEGLVAGDVVCLFMLNHPLYMAIWLGLTRVGITVALVNTNLTGEALAHSVNAVRPRAIIIGPSLSAAATAIRTLLPDGLRYWSIATSGSEWPCVDESAMRLPADQLAQADFSAPLLRDRALFIYTSGTTGMPKAAIVTHFRLMQWTHWFAGMMEADPKDRMYNCLPMYHSIGGVVATGAPMVAGASVVLRERFSATRFWEDIRSEHCTLFQYIGELCRYLLACPASPDETSHTLRLCCGNGLRREIWVEFQRRFRVPRILEYYASTEGSFSLYNCEGRPGAIGRIPPFLRHRDHVALVQFDWDSELPLRDAAGRCVRCVPGEVGEAIGEIVNPTGVTTGRFEGYTDVVASERKILRNVFAIGDAWYRTGDLMTQDTQGFFYFVDRVGDTFRWKGENISTTEVGAAMACCNGVNEVAVYGTSVPGTDGRAGMAALVVDTGFTVRELLRGLIDRLPEYARPLFLRIVPKIAITATFKLRKQSLLEEGWNPENISDELYFYDRMTCEYVPLDNSLYQRIVTGGIRV